MEVHVPDPAWAGAGPRATQFRLARRLAIGFVALLWLLQAINALLGLDPAPFGVRPRDPAGLVGIVTAPLVHASFAHLVANTPPLLVLGTAMLYLYPKASPRVLPAIFLGPGIAVWLFARPDVHLGASGIVYGLLAYVLIAGLLRRDRRAVAAFFVVSFLYGSLVWGVLPGEPQMSWETHLAAAVLGALLALACRRLDVPPRKRYTWEDEREADRDEDDPDAPWRLPSPVAADAARTTATSTDPGHDDVERRLH